MVYYLMKSEPGSYSIDDLERDGSTCWDGVRNYEARNLMRGMKVGDKVLFYHSNVDPPAVVGLAKVSRAAYPDPTAFDRKSKYYDARSTPADPVWSMVDIAFVRRLRPVSLADLRDNPALTGMALLRPFQRLSVQPVEAAHFDEVVRMSKRR
jgi:predicted RNA-binding protein with PUA-like domain